MRSAFLIAIAAGSALLMTAPLAAQSTNQPSTPPPPAAPAQTTVPQPVAPASVADPAKSEVQADDTKTDPKAKPKADTSTCTPITAGPNQGQFIGRCKHRRS